MKDKNPVRLSHVTGDNTRLQHDCSYASANASASSNTAAQAVSGPTSPGRGKHRRTIIAARRQTSTATTSSHLRTRNSAVDPPHVRAAFWAAALEREVGTEDRRPQQLRTRGVYRTFLLFEHHQHTLTAVLQLSDPSGPAPLASGEAISTSAQSPTVPSPFPHQPSPVPSQSCHARDCVQSSWQNPYSRARVSLASPEHASRTTHREQDRPRPEHPASCAQQERNRERSDTVQPCF